jgi:uncharacterized membrane protein
MKDFFQHFQRNVFRGLLAIIPIGLSIMTIMLLYGLIDKKVMGFLDKFVEVRWIPGLGILLVLICLYLIGIIVSHYLGRNLFRFIENVSRNIPIIQTVYQVGKQLSDGLSDMKGVSAFKKAILVDWNNSQLWTVGFLMGEMQDQNTKEIFLRVFVPNVPNPATGLVFLVKPAQTLDPGWSVEEALKVIVSAGIISPAELRIKTF